MGIFDEMKKFEEAKESKSTWVDRKSKMSAEMITKKDGIQVICKVEGSSSSELRALILSLAVTICNREKLNPMDFFLQMGIDMLNNGGYYDRGGENGS